MDEATIIEAITVWVPQVITVASIITALTPTPKDDNILRMVRNIIAAVALNVGKAKQSDPE